MILFAVFVVYVVIAVLWFVMLTVLYFAEGGREYARLAVKAPAWPFMLARAFTRMFRDARKADDE